MTDMDSLVLLCQHFFIESGTFETSTQRKVFCPSPDKDLVLRVLVRLRILDCSQSKPGHQLTDTLISGCRLPSCPPGVPAANGECQLDGDEGGPPLL